MENARMGAPKIIAAMVLWLGLGACSERDGLEVARSSFSSAASTFLTGNAATACVNGTYQGTATATVTFPSGHVPTSETRRKTSKRITIAC